MKYALLVLAFLLCLPLPAQAQEVVYSSVIEDLPLMADMVENADAAVEFDKPAGRIVESSATTEASFDEIEAFYLDTLPALGWKREGALLFTREGESLFIKIEQRPIGFEVQFLLTPIE